MSWRRNPRALGAIGALPHGARNLLYGIALVVGFVILGELLMAKPIARTDRRIENLQKLERSRHR